MYVCFSGYYSVENSLGVEVPTSDSSSMKNIFFCFQIKFVLSTVRGVTRNRVVTVQIWISQTAKWNALSHWIGKLIVVWFSSTNSQGQKTLMIISDDDKISYEDIIHMKIQTDWYTLKKLIGNLIVIVQLSYTVSSIAFSVWNNFHV